MSNLNEVLGKMTEFLKTEAKTETIIGEQFKLGEYTCVPIMHVGLGFGGGSGEGKGAAKDKAEGQGFGAAGAAGIGMGPVGFLVSRNNEIRFIHTHTSKGLGLALEKLPELVDKYLDQNKKKSRTPETVEA
ncbi:MAG TPA: GerW family sporulation protein [Saprospiraceae bacterium]|nr:GerW family sporulation protein [Saprospiraceae bacterium]